MARWLTITVGCVLLMLMHFGTARFAGSDVACSAGCGSAPFFGEDAEPPEAPSPSADAEQWASVLRSTKFNFWARSRSVAHGDRDGLSPGRQAIDALFKPPRA